MAGGKELRADIVIGGKADASFYALGGALQTLGGQLSVISDKLIDFGTESTKVYTGYEDNLLDTQVALRTQYESASELQKVMKQLDSQAMQWANNTRFTTTDVTEAISEASHAGWDLDKILEGIPAAMNISMAGSMSLSEGLEYLVDITNAAGLSFEDLGSLTDYWAYAANKSSTTIPEMGAAMPQSGGRVVYLNEAYHPIVGFMNGFVDWLIGGPGSVAALALALMGVFQPIFHLSDFGCKIAAVVLIFGITAYNMVGVKLASVVQNVSMIAKMVPVAIILLAALFVGRVTPDLSFGSAGVYAAENNTSVFSMIALAVVASLWAYEGWTNLNTVAEEMKNPRKNLPLALIIGIGGVTILYTLFNFAIMKVLPHEEIVSMIDAGDLYLGTAVAKKLLGSAGAVVVTVGMVLAMFGSMNGLILAQPRMYYAMAKEGHFFKSFTDAAHCNLHITATGENEHHKIEGIFKAFSRALRMAASRNSFKFELPSSKGML